MAQSLSNVVIHTIFSTKDRCACIIPDLQTELHAYLAKICQAHGSYVFKVGGVEDHVHLCTTLPRTLSQSAFIEELKTSSSKWIKTKHPSLKAFSWQKGFGMFSISHKHTDALVQYIANQQEHHKKIDFKSELLHLLKKNNLSFDEKYLWN
jgi:putative transposase